jgi:hypothetical protein
MMPSDIERVHARHRRRQTYPTHECPDQPAVSDDVQFLIDQLIAARAEVHRLTEDDEDLRASAEIWCRLYEAALERASAAEAEAARRVPVLPPHMRGLSDALDRVADLTNALSVVVRECALCARDTPDPSDVSQVAKDACVRCAKVLEALSRPGR